MHSSHPLPSLQPQNLNLHLSSSFASNISDESEMKKGFLEIEGPPNTIVGTRRMELKSRKFKVLKSLQEIEFCK